jgi:hypothetical protein
MPCRGDYGTTINCMNRRPATDVNGNCTTAVTGTAPHFQITSLASSGDLNSTGSVPSEVIGDKDLERAIAASLQDCKPTPTAAKLQSLLKSQYNKRTVKIDGFGDCQFMALSHQLYGTPNRHLDIRTRCCDYIERHPELLYHTGNENDDIKQYLTRMRLPAASPGSSYGDEITLAAFYAVYSRPVLQYRLDQYHQSVICGTLTSESMNEMISDPRTLHVFYDPVRQHYDSVVECHEPSLQDSSPLAQLFAVKSSPTTIDLSDDTPKKLPECEPSTAAASALPVIDLSGDAPSNPSSEPAYIRRCIATLTGENYTSMLTDSCVRLYIDTLIEIGRAHV